jgi:hypothetical protein
MTKLKITVTKEILEKSKYCGKRPYGEEIEDDAPSNCAIALAVREIFPFAWVGEDEIDPFYRTIVGFEFRPLSERIELPTNAKNFITRFDGTSADDRPLLPEISFEVEIPDCVIDQINIDELRPLLANHPTLELVGK